MTTLNLAWRDAELVLEGTGEAGVGAEAYFVGDFSDVQDVFLEQFHGPVEAVVGQEGLGLQGGIVFPGQEGQDPDRHLQQGYPAEKKERL